MKKTIDKDSIQSFKSMRACLNIEDAVKESGRCLLCEDPPCSKACPAGTDPGSFIRKIRFENYKGAARTIRENNILGGSCAHICPVEKLCEKSCSAACLEESVNIAGLQRFAVEYGRTHNLEKFSKSTGKSGKVAIIGAGPAGLSCAYELAKLDYAVSVFDKDQSPGGVPTHLIPDFRLPPETALADMQNLLDLGVEFHCNRNLETTDSFQALTKEGYKTVFLATGLSEPFVPNVFANKKWANVFSYNDFLRKIKLDHRSFSIAGKRVAVVGGGSVALDCANTASALKASRVYVIALEDMLNLPADRDEVALGHTGGVVFKPSTMISEATALGNKVVSLKGHEIEFPKGAGFDPARAKSIEGTDFSLNVDLVVLAIGTRTSKKIAQTYPGLKLTERGHIKTDENFATNIPGLYSAGDVVNRGTTVAQAVGEGKKAAQAIHQFITGRK
jgi:NADPH-dependent glutamate synthase beta subunit-like oxidoreductase